MPSDDQARLDAAEATIASLRAELADAAFAVTAWLADPQRKPAALAFSSGLARQMADLCEMSAKAERERIVAWLREQASDPCWVPNGFTARTLTDAADAIARGATDEQRDAGGK